MLLPPSKESCKPTIDEKACRRSVRVLCLSIRDYECAKVTHIVFYSDKIGYYYTINYGFILTVLLVQFSDIPLGYIIQGYRKRWTGFEIAIT